MKFEDMYVGQKVRVRSWEDIMSDPNLKQAQYLGEPVIVHVDPDDRGIFFNSEKHYCGAAMTVDLLAGEMADGMDSRRVLVSRGDEYTSCLFPPWIFEPIDIEVKIESDVFLSCLLL